MPIQLHDLERRPVLTIKTDQSKPTTEKYQMDIAVLNLIWCVDLTSYPFEDITNHVIKHLLTQI